MFTVSSTSLLKNVSDLTVQSFTNLFQSAEDYGLLALFNPVQG
jgi:hypothetical protein